MSGQSDSSSDANQLRFCSALQPAVHIKALAAACHAAKTNRLRDVGIALGGEDWPDAYRYTPMEPADALGCVVVSWHPDGGPAFHIYHGLLFGLPLAVTSFNRFSKLAEAMVRRLLFMLF